MIQGFCSNPVFEITDGFHLSRTWEPTWSLLKTLTSTYELEWPGGKGQCACHVHNLKTVLSRFWWWPTAHLSYWCAHWALVYGLWPAYGRAIIAIVDKTEIFLWPVEYGFRLVPSLGWQRAFNWVCWSWCILVNSTQSVGGASPPCQQTGPKFICVGWGFMTF